MGHVTFLAYFYLPWLLLTFLSAIETGKVRYATMSDGIVAETGPMRGRRRVSQMIDFVSKLQPSGTSYFAEAGKRFRARVAHFWSFEDGIPVSLVEYMDTALIASQIRE